MSHREKQLKKSAVRVVESDLGVIDLPYLLLTLLLVAIGLLVLFSASYARAYYETKNSSLSLRESAHFCRDGHRCDVAHQPRAI